jgi:two-component system, NtrC family, sensor histidine kinase HydH
MTTQNWVTLIACVGELAVAVLVALRALGSPLATPLLILSVDLCAWNFAQLGYYRSGHIEWHLLDMVASPMGIAFTLQFMLRFLGRSRQLRAPLVAAFIYYGALALIAALGILWPAARHLALSPGWSWAWLAGMLPLSLLTVGLLVVHLRRVGGIEERNRTWLLLAAVVAISPLAQTEVWADLGFGVPRLGSTGIFTFNAILLVAVLRFRLFDRALSGSTVLSATVLAAVGVLAYLSVFRAAGTNAALLVLGTVTVTLMLLAAARLVIVTIIHRREQLVRFATLGKMSAQMAHDLKNPLAALKGAAQLLREERSQGRSIDDKTEFLDLLVEQSNRLESAVDKYQRLGRLEAVRTPVQLNELVRSLVTLQKLGGGHEIAVRTELAADLPECPVDRELVAGALENLLQNAFEASPRDRTVTVRTAIASARHSRGVLLSVEDQGVGMSERTRQWALDDFFTTKTKGSGLGLPFVRRVAEAHGGEVTLVSKEGAGTTVRLFLPLEGARS